MPEIKISFYLQSGPISASLSGFPVTAYNRYALLFCFAGIANPCAAFAKTFEFLKLATSLVYFKVMDGQYVVSIHGFKMNPVSESFPSHSVNDSGVDDDHRKRMLFETIRDRFE